MFDVLGFAAHLTHMASELEGDKREDLERVGKMVETEAKSAIGTYKYGWPPLAASTLAKKKADTPLLETGEMRNSISHAISGPNSVDVGSNNQKAVWHELGTTKAPPRSFLVKAAQTKEPEVVGLMESRLVRRIGLAKP